MAQGNLSIFDEAKLAIANAVHDFDTDVFKVAFITTIPAKSNTANPPTNIHQVLTPFVANAFKEAASVIDKVLPSPVFISATLPS